MTRWSTSRRRGLLRPARPPLRRPSEAELDAARRLIDSQSSTVPYLVYLRDKTLLFSADRRAFLMFAVQGRTWVAMGDPIGDPRSITGLIRRFFELADHYRGVPVFYQVGKEKLYQYADFGLAFAKLGEEASVDLSGFTLSGAANKRFRLVLNRFGRTAMTFRVTTGEEVDALIPALREVSDAWLLAKRASEKGFSLGFFAAEYVRRFPVALVEDQGRIVAFATVWPGPGRAELSVDLMRYRPDAPGDVMEALMVNLMMWGRAEGYGRFNLGMAPLSGLQPSPVAPLWTRIGNFLFQRGAALYNFQGLRTYKEKFHPSWEPRYLVYPGKLALPRITADVWALVGRGHRSLFRGRRATETGNNGGAP